LPMKFYDAHIHFYFTFPAEELRRLFARFTETGLAGFTALTVPEFPGELEKVFKMMPAASQSRMSLAVLENQKDPFPYVDWAKPLTMLPFADTRFIETGIEGKVARFKQCGFKGLKILYVPEADNQMRIEGMEQAFGRPVRKSEEITARLVDSADSQGMCVLFHVDLRRYGSFAEEMIAGHPKTKFNIPHFGFSRKAMSHLLETCANCYTDTSALVPFLEGDPESYRSFIRQYGDRILFGSDAFICDPERVQASRSAVERLLDDEELFHKLGCINYREFHGITGPKA
jgi:hypothetical protein